LLVSHGQELWRFVTRYVKQALLCSDPQVSKP
jgi:hypothetical protein